MIDDIDRAILTIIQNDARISNTDIAKRIGMAPSGVLERIRKLEEKGIIEGYTARVNAAKLEFGLVAFVFVGTDDRVGEVTTAKLLAAIPEVQEVHHIAGEDCFLVKVRAKDTNHLSALLRERFGTIKSLRTTRTTIVLDTVKEMQTLPINFSLQAGRTNGRRTNTTKK